MTSTSVGPRRRCRNAPRDAPHDREAVPLPETHRAFVAGGDEVELHGLESSRARRVERMHAHGAGDPAAARLRRHHVSGVGHVIAEARLVGPEAIRAHHHPVLTRREAAGRRPRPENARLLERHLRIVGVGVAGGDDGVEDRPDELELTRPDLADVERRHLRVPSP